MRSTTSTTSTTATTRRLGKLPARSDVRTLTLGRYVDRGTVPEPPARLDLAAPVREWPMYANDRIGDCTTAAAGHMVEAWTAAASGRTVELAEADVVAAFEAVKILDPLTGEEGAIELDVLRRWRSIGIGGHRIGAFARVSTGDQMLARTAAALFGGVYIGLQLPLTAQEQEVWDWTGTLEGRAAPGSWGGHAVNVVGYDDTGVTVVTWGTIQRATWPFWQRYCDEAYAVLSVDFLAEGRSPAGLDLDTLRRDLALVTAAGRRA